MSEEQGSQTTHPDYPGAHAAWSADGGQAGYGASGDGDSRQAWEARSRIVLNPVAAPSIMGLFGFAAATFMVASVLAGWWGSPGLAFPVIAPFAITFGGIGQFLAGMWAYKARDGVATAMHTMWGTFWIAWGALVLLTAGGFFPMAVLTGRAAGFWFIMLGLITGLGAIAAYWDNLAIFSVLVLLSGGSCLLAVGFVGNLPYWTMVGGWVLVASAAAALYTAFALMAKGARGGRTLLPVGATFKPGPNLPGHRETNPMSYSGGMPGAKAGQ
jgi:succinate-acetate transporter protein